MKAFTTATIFFFFLFKFVFPKFTSFHVSFLSRVTAQLVEHCRAKAEAMGSSLVEVRSFFSDKFALA